MAIGIDYDLSACLEYNPQDGFTVEDIAEVLAVWEGENDGDDWRWILRLNDNRFVFLRGGCDYTGWDCQSFAVSRFAATALDLLAVPDIGDDVHTELLIQLETSKNKTWRETKDDELKPPPFIDLVPTRVLTMITTWGVIQTITGPRSVAYVFRPFNGSESAEQIYREQIAGHVLFTDPYHTSSAEALMSCEVWFISFGENGYPKFERVC